jgi:hypothetical protein
VITIADKSRTVFPIAVSFYDGELPSATKLNGLATQAKQGMGIIEYALGDLWNQGGDAYLANLTNARLMIPNLARYLGPIRHTSPRLPNLSGLEEYTHQFSDRISDYEARLPYPVHSTSTFTWSNPSWFNNRVANKYDVKETGDWWIDYRTGDIVTWKTLHDDHTLTYKPGYIDSEGAEQAGIYGDVGEQSTFNVIPDLDTGSSYNFQGLKIQDEGSPDTYYIYLPPRMPLDSRNINISPQVIEHSNNFASSPDSVHSKRFFQLHTVAACTLAANASHYRYSLPKVLTDNWTNGMMIPTGMLYLWDPVGTGTVIDGLTFYAEAAASPRSWVLVVRGANLTSWLATTRGLLQYPSSRLSSSNHTYSYYPNNGLYLICVGTDTSAAISSLFKSFLDHNHGEQTLQPTKRILHSSLAKTYNAEYLGNTDVYLDYSGLDSDDHPQYLERHGFSEDRDRYGNSMVGELVLSSTGSYNNYLNITSNSNKLSFGTCRSENGASFYWKASSEVLEFLLPSTVSIPGIHITKDGTNDNSDPYNPGESTSLTVGRIYPGAHYDSTYGYSGSVSFNYGPVREIIISPFQFTYGEIASGGLTIGNKPSYASSSNNFYTNVESIYTVDAYSTAVHSFCCGKIVTPSSSGNTTYAFYSLDLPFALYSIIDLNFYYADYYSGHTAGTDISSFNWQYFRLLLTEPSMEPLSRTLIKSVPFNNSTFISSPNDANPVISESFAHASSALGSSYTRLSNHTGPLNIILENHTGVGSNHNLLFGSIKVKYRIREW